MTSVYTIKRSIRIEIFKNKALTWLKTIPIIPLQLCLSASLNRKCCHREELVRTYEKQVFSLDFYSMLIQLNNVKLYWFWRSQIILQQYPFNSLVRIPHQSRPIHVDSKLPKSKITMKLLWILGNMISDRRHAIQLTLLAHK